MLLLNVIISISIIIFSVLIIFLIHASKKIMPNKIRNVFPSLSNNSI